MLVVLDSDLERRKRVRRTALVLAIVVIGFYIGFIVMSVVRAERNGGGTRTPPGQTAAVPR